MRVGAFAFLRLIIMLRRIWQSVDRLAEIEQARLDLEKDRMAIQYPKWSGGRLPSATKKTTISVAGVDDLNKGWRERNPYEKEDPYRI